MDIYTTHASIYSVLTYSDTYIYHIYIRILVRAYTYTQKNSKTEKMLHVALSKGDWPSALSLLEDCDVNVRERTGGTPLMVAASMMEVDLEIVKKMLERGARIDDVDDEVRFVSF